MTETTFEAGTGRADRQIHIENKRPLGGGVFGDIYVVTVHPVQGSAHPREMILKEYRPRPNQPGSDQHFAAAAVEHHRLAKQAGLNVFKTFRRSLDGSAILMTLADSEHWICVGSNQGTKTVRERSGSELNLQPDNHFSGFLERYFAQASLAATAGLVLTADIPFFLVERQQRQQLDFVLGDMDMLESARGAADVQSDNVYALYVALRLFLQHNQGDSPAILAMIDQACRQHGANPERLAAMTAETQPNELVA